MPSRHSISLSLHTCLHSQFLGLLKDKRPVPVGSPFQQNFHIAGGAGGGGSDDDDDDDDTKGGGDGRPVGFDGALDGEMAGCGDNALRCSCSDCPTGGGCEAPVGVDIGKSGQSIPFFLSNYTLYPLIPLIPLILTIML